MNLKLISILLYGITGIIFILIGTTVLMVSTGILPDSISQIVFNFGKNDPNTLHIVQEFGSLLLFAGLVSIWFISHYEMSLYYHWAMTVFFVSFAFVHWVNINGTINRETGPIVTTIPFILYLIVGLLRWNKEKIN